MTGTGMNAQQVKVTRWVAIVAGLIGFVLSALTPLLPVVQTTAQLEWPQAQGQHRQFGNVTAPLISQTPVTMKATIPCDVLRTLPPSGGLVFGTVPKDGKQAALNGLLVNVSSSRVDITDRNVVIASVPRLKAIGSPGCSHIEIISDKNGTFATFVGLTGADGKELRTGFADPNLRPTVVGIFTDLKGAAPQGLSVSATIDTRFINRPTIIKYTAMFGGIVATIVALLALWRLDRLDGRRMQRLIPSRWRTFNIVDGVVVGGFLLWHVLGAGSSDDGYILGMARVAPHAQYMINYFRWFGSPEDPFGWYYNVLALMTHISDASIWIRLPDLVCALICWLLLSREVLPRLGPAVAGSKAAMWAAGLVLMAAWMPFDNGLRPEGQIATGALITYVLIERAIGTSRLTPAALAIISAAFTLGIQPTGLIAVAALLAGGRPILRILAKRRREVGTWPLLMPLLAAGFVVLTVVFVNQTAAGVLEATRIRTAIGPSQAWYTENLRYYYLFLPTVDGSMTRRFGFLLTALSLFTSMFMILRRKRVPGIARGPLWRLMGIIFATMFCLMFTPTKWVHHFGLFAAVGAAMAAVATVLVSRSVLKSARNRMAVTSAVLFLLALVSATTNGWWYVSSYGVPFNNDMVAVGGIKLSTIFLALFVITAVWAFWLHFNSDRPEGRLTRLVTAAPIPLAAAFMVVVCVASMAIGAVREYPTYSNLASNLRALKGGCGLADNVLVEPDSNAGFLTPQAGDYGPLGALGGVAPVGFAPNGVPDRIVAEAIRLDFPMPGTDSDWDAAAKLKTPGINGSTVPLPYGLDPARVPVAGTYTTGPHSQAKLTSAWYGLPTLDAGHPLVVVTAAGTITGNSSLKGRTEGQTVELEYGRTGPDGHPVAGGRVVPYDIGPTPSWRNLRFDRRQIPADATFVRVVAVNLSLNEGDWIAVTPPRVPEVKTLEEFVGKTQPVLMDWAVGLAFPCQQPMLVRNGVTEVPKFRITPDYTAKKQDTDTWQDGINGGLLGITDVLLKAHVMSTYLSDDWGRDWGSLRAFTTVVDATTAELDLGTAVHSGLWSPGKMRIKP